MTHVYKHKPDIGSARVHRGVTRDYHAWTLWPLLLCKQPFAYKAVGLSRSQKVVLTHGTGLRTA